MPKAQPMPPADQDRVTWPDRIRAWSVLPPSGCAFFALLAAILLPTASQAYQFQARGSLLTTYYPLATGTSNRVRTTAFLVSVSNQQWSIELRSSQAPVTQSLATDGDSTFLLVSPITEATNRSADALIQPAPYPKRAPRAARILFLAFASGELYDSITNKSALAPWRDEDTPPDYYRISMERMAESPRLPLAMTYEGPNYIEFFDPKTGQVTYQWDTENPPVVVGRYRVLQTTNIFGLLLPVAFECLLHSYGRLRENASEADARLESHIGEVESLTSEGTSILLPTIAGQVKVRDERLAGGPLQVQPLSYVLSNLAWLATNDPVVLARLAKAEASARDRLRQKQIRRFGWIAAPLLVLPPLLVYWTQRRKRPSEN